MKHYFIIKFEDLSNEKQQEIRAFLAEYVLDNAKPVDDSGVCVVGVEKFTNIDKALDRTWMEMEVIVNA